jgi:hypothetical protein
LARGMGELTMVNIIPVNDERPHEKSSECWCNPRVEWISPKDGLPYQRGPMIVHNSADCREVVERAIGEGV